MSPLANDTSSDSNMQDVVIEDVLFDDSDGYEILDLEEHLNTNDYTSDDNEQDGVNDSPIIASCKIEHEKNYDFVFSKHEGSVFTCQFHPLNDNMLVSAGSDDKAYVWKIPDDTNLDNEDNIFLICDEFHDSIDNATFSHDGKYLAVCDLSGIIRVWHVNRRAIVWDYEIGEISWLKWHPGSNVLFAGTVASDVWMWRIPCGTSKVLHCAGASRCESAQILPDGRRMVCGYNDGSLIVFNLQTGKSINVLCENNNNRPILCIDVHPDDNIIVAGGYDGLSKLYNVQSNRCIATFKSSPKSLETDDDLSNSVESILFSRCNQRIVTGTDEGVVTVWDIGSQTARLIHYCNSAVIKLLWYNGIAIENHKTTLLVAMLEGIDIIDTNSGTLLGRCIGHNADVLDMSQSSDGRFLSTASDDGNCLVYRLDNILATKKINSDVSC